MILIYIVEDNPDLLSDALIWLNDDMFTCHGATDAKGLENLLQTQLPDIIVLDWMLPGEDGLSIANRLRESQDEKEIGLVFMTARVAIDDRLAGLDVADAYLTKPVDYRELKAVINSVVRRTRKTGAHATTPWQLNTSQLFIYTPSKKRILLTERETIILQFFIQNTDKTIPIEELKAAVENNHPLTSKNSLERLISRLRYKLKQSEDISDNPIRAYRHNGYRFMLPSIIYDAEASER